MFEHYINYTPEIRVGLSLIGVFTAVFFIGCVLYGMYLLKQEEKS